MILREERGRFGAALGHDDVEAGDFFAVGVKVEFFSLDNGFEPDAGFFEFLAARHRDHKGLLVRRYPVTGAQRGNICGK